MPAQLPWPVVTSPMMDCRSCFSNIQEFDSLCLLSLCAEAPPSYDESCSN